MDCTVSEKPTLCSEYVKDEMLNVPTSVFFIFDSKAKFICASSLRNRPSAKPSFQSSSVSDTAAF